jgi:hypothetical protein
MNSLNPPDRQPTTIANRPTAAGNSIADSRFQDIADFAIEAIEDC